MNKSYLQSQIKSTNTAYIFWFFLGAHYAYLGRWGTQILYWLTLGGIGFWALFDLFTMKSKVERHNFPLFNQIAQLENAEKEAELNRQLAIVAAISGKNQ